MFCVNMGIKWSLGGGPSFWPGLLQSLILHNTLMADGFKTFAGPDSKSWYFQVLNNLSLKLELTLLPHSSYNEQRYQVFLLTLPTLRRSPQGCQGTSTYTCLMQNSGCLWKDKGIKRNCCINRDQKVRKFPFRKLSLSLDLSFQVLLGKRTGPRSTRHVGASYSPRQTYIATSSSMMPASHPYSSKVTMCLLKSC